MEFPPSSLQGSDHDLINQGDWAHAAAAVVFTHERRYPLHLRLESQAEILPSPTVSACSCISEKEQKQILRVSNHLLVHIEFIRLSVVRREYPICNSLAICIMRLMA